MLFYCILGISVWASARFGHLHGWQECSDQRRREKLATNVQTAQEAVSCANASCMWCGSGMCTLTVVLRGFSLITLIIDAFNARCSRFSKIIVLIPSSSSTWHISMIYSQFAHTIQWHAFGGKANQLKFKVFGREWERGWFSSYVSPVKDKAVVDG